MTEAIAGRCPICRISTSEFAITCGGCKQRSSGQEISSAGYCPHCGDRYLFVTPNAQPAPVAPRPASPAANSVSDAKPVSVAPPRPTPEDAAKPEKQEKPADSPANLLDRLKQQAAEKIANEAKQKGLGEQQRRSLSKALFDTYSYLSAFTEQVNTLKPDFPMRHFIGDQVRFDGLAWKEGFSDYRTLPGSTENRLVQRVSLSYILAGKNPIVVEREHPQIELFARTLNDHGLLAATQDYKNNLGRTIRTRFEIKPEVVASLVFVADYDAGNIRLSTRNVQRLGNEDYSIPLDGLSAAALEDLALLVLGTSKQFVQRFKRIL